MESARIYYVYVWYKADDKSPFYVGKGKGPRSTQLVNRNRYFMNTYRKHGGFSLIIAEGLTDQESQEKEIETIRELRKEYKLTNLTDGGEGVSGMQHSDKTKNMLSELSVKQWVNPETRARLILARREGHSKPEVRAKMSASHKGKVLTDEHKGNITSALATPEVRQLMSEAKTKYRNIKCSLPDIENGESINFYNTRDAVDWLKSIGIEAKLSTLIGVIKRKRSVAYGFCWNLGQ